MVDSIEIASHDGADLVRWIGKRRRLESRGGSTTGQQARDHTEDEDETTHPAASHEDTWRKDSESA
jgi:hypothetical protein